ncbi:Protein SOSEKI [Dillenia turbinata]|uniref:Protein SOSEKI n=1 Tax=Dillenia turbinata TaxID=194707 RepID=A0AAN8VH43_9MAGN
MAMSSRGSRTAEISMMSKKYRERETSPERTKIWVEPKPHYTHRTVPVVYYLSRNGHLDHPHFLEVTLSSSHGLYLRDVINKLSVLRGKIMPSMYSWSSKRSYKNGFVWQDLTENDFIYPVHGHEYVLKGSEIVDNFSSFRSCDSISSDKDKPNASNHSNSTSLDSNEYKIYKVESAEDLAGKALNAATQTEEETKTKKNKKSDRIQIRRRFQVEEEEEDELYEHFTIDLSKDEIPPRASNSSPEEGLDSASRVGDPVIIRERNSVDSVGVGLGPADIRNQTAQNEFHSHSARMKTSTVLMQLFTCGSVSVKESTVGNGRGCPVWSQSARRTKAEVERAIGKAEDCGEVAL